MFSRFDTIHACDRQIERQTDRQTELAWHIRAIAYMLSRVKNGNFRRHCSLLSFDALYPANPREYPHNVYILAKKSLCATFLLLIVWAIFIQQENSAKLTNQRVSDAFTSSPFSIHVRHILPTSKFQHSYFTFFLYQCSEQHV